MSFAKGVHRWAFNQAQWCPSAKEWERALALEPDSEEVRRIKQFVFERDAKASLAGRLMARKLASKCLGMCYSEVQLARTSGRKPYIANIPLPRKFPNFNLNISHHGDWVVATTEPVLLSGVDVMTTFLERGDPGLFFNTMQDNFTPSEWAVIKADKDSKDNFHQFFRHWALKESYIKGIGIGLDFDLQRAEFTYSRNDPKAAQAQIFIDGQNDPSWDFNISYLDNNHVVVVARGPPSDAHPTFAPYINTDISPEELMEARNLPAVDFEMVVFNDLLPDHDGSGDSDDDVADLF